MEGTLPECDFANVVLWNVHMQTFEYRHRRCSVNSAQMALGPDRTYRVVIADEDPGRADVQDWLDTEGHRRGTIFWRFLLPRTAPETPRCRVVPVAELRG
jgi:hypothetical protein